MAAGALPASSVAHHILCSHQGYLIAWQGRLVFFKFFLFYCFQEALFEIIVFVQLIVYLASHAVNTHIANTEVGCIMHVLTRFPLMNILSHL